MTTIDDIARREGYLSLSDYDVAISNQQDLLTVPSERIEAIVRDVLQREGINRADVSIALIDSNTMRRLNNAHLGHDYDTDVLSFLFDSTIEETDNEQIRLIEGEILVSTQIALNASATHGWDAEDEVILYIVHGLLHLLGYDDRDAEDQRAMIARERYHLGRWGLTPPGRGETSDS